MRIMLAGDGVLLLLFPDESPARVPGHFHSPNDCPGHLGLLPRPSLHPPPLFPSSLSSPSSACIF